MILPIDDRPRAFASRRAQQAVQPERPIGILLQRNPEIDQPGPGGSALGRARIANVLRYVTAPDGAHHMICQGSSAFASLEFLDGYPFLAARVQLIEEPERDRQGNRRRASCNLKERAIEVLQLMPQAPQELVAAVQSIERPARAGRLRRRPDGHQGAEEKQEMLETFDLQGAARRLLELLAHRIEVLRLRARSTSAPRRASDERQREHLLREQMQLDPEGARRRRRGRRGRDRRARAGASPTRRCRKKWKSRRARN